VAYGYVNGEQKTAGGALANPFELYQLGGTANVVGGLAGPVGGRLALGYFPGGNYPPLTAVQVGYCSLAGSACAKGSNCCSGVCQAVIDAGPKAYSLCQ
jgi:hypothetical protein